jgi:hypothetical protein
MMRSTAAVRRRPQTVSCNRNRFVVRQCTLLPRSLTAANRQITSARIIDTHYSSYHMTGWNKPRQLPGRRTVVCAWTQVLQKHVRCGVMTCYSSTFLYVIDRSAPHARLSLHTCLLSIRSCPSTPISLLMWSCTTEKRAHVH